MIVRYEQLHLKSGWRWNITEYDVCLPVSIAPIYIYILYCSVIYKITTQPWEQGRVLFLLSLPFLLSAEDLVMSGKQEHCEQFLLFNNLRHFKKEQFSTKRNIPIYSMFNHYFR